METPYHPGAEPVPGFRLVRPLGRGGFGQVWQAVGPGGTDVALKIISLSDPQGLREFRALRLVQHLPHPHLVPLLAVWFRDGDGRLFGDPVPDEQPEPRAVELILAMGLGEKNLLDRLTECQAEGIYGIPPGELLGYVTESAEALDFLHRPRPDASGGPVGIQHCDVKPQNILIVGDSAQLGDFGLARVLEGDSAAVPGDGRGYTPCYAAPELFSDRVTRWTDQYALALTYFKLRTGRWPFDADKSFYELMVTHVEGAHDFRPLPEAERRVLARATAVVPEERFPSCREMVAALEKTVAIAGPIQGPARVTGGRIQGWADSATDIPPWSPAELHPTATACLGPREAGSDGDVPAVPFTETHVGPHPVPDTKNDLPGKTTPSLPLPSSLDPLGMRAASRRKSMPAILGGLVVVSALGGGLGVWQFGTQPPAPPLPTGKALAPPGHPVTAKTNPPGSTTSPRPSDAKVGTQTGLAAKAPAPARTADGAAPAAGAGEDTEWVWEVAVRLGELTIRAKPDAEAKRLVADLYVAKARYLWQKPATRSAPVEWERANQMVAALERALELHRDPATLLALSRVYLGRAGLGPTRAAQREDLYRSLAAADLARLYHPHAEEAVRCKGLALAAIDKWQAEEDKVRSPQH